MAGKSTEPPRRISQVEGSFGAQQDERGDGSVLADGAQQPDFESIELRGTTDVP